MPSIAKKSAKGHIKGPIRLYVDASLDGGVAVDLTADQAHYVAHVMRRTLGDPVQLFNGDAGEWRAIIEKVGKNRCHLRVEDQSRAQEGVPDLWLVFAPVKRLRLDYLVQKATELGISRLQPVTTHRTIVSRINDARLRANMVEAAEQTGRLTIPELAPLVRLPQLLENWDRQRRLVFCDIAHNEMDSEENTAELSVPLLSQALDRQTQGPWAILIGPEGGFSPEERTMLQGTPFVLPASLGPRILRTDTAAIAALTLWQSILGDWSSR